MREHLPTLSDLLDLIIKSLIITILVIFMGSFEKNDISYFISFFVFFSIILTYRYTLCILVFKFFNIVRIICQQSMNRIFVMVGI